MVEQGWDSARNIIVKGQKKMSVVVAVFYVLNWCKYKDVQFITILYAVHMYFLLFLG